MFGDLEQTVGKDWSHERCTAPWSPTPRAPWDVTTATGEHVHIKCRVVGPKTGHSAKFSAFRSYDFDTAVFVVLAESTYEVVSAFSVLSASVEAKARFSGHIAGSFLSIGTNLMSLTGALSAHPRGVGASPAHSSGPAMAVPGLPHHTCRESPGRAAALDPVSYAAPVTRHDGTASHRHLTGARACETSNRNMSRSG